MPRPVDPEVEKLNRKIRELLTRIYDQAAGEPDAALIKQLADAKRLLADRSQQAPAPRPRVRNRTRGSPE